jgi:hypothetical protein
MIFPVPYESGFAIILYMFLLLIVATGSWQFVRSRYQLKEGESMRMRSLIPLGGAAAAFGIVGLLKHWADAFEAMQVAEDISPTIVAGAMKSAVAYPILGFFILAVSCVFRFVNQPDAKKTKLS